MFTEVFEPELKQIKLATDGAVQRCQLQLEMALSSELAYGLPNGKALDKLLRAGDIDVVKMPAEGVSYNLKVTLPLPLSDAAKPEPPVEIAVVTVDEATLAAKEDKETGDRDVTLKLLLGLRWTDADLLFFAHHLKGRMFWTLTKRQMDLPLDAAEATTAPKKRGNNKQPKTEA